MLLAPLALAACGSGEQAASSAERPPLEGAAIGGPFTLVDKDGETVTWNDFKRRYRIVYFGYTFCPDACPLDMQALMQGFAQFEKASPQRAAKVQPLFITIDPERDTPEQIKTYLSNEVFPKGTIGLTGTPEQVAAAAKAYRVYYKKNGEGSDYLVDHSTPAYLMNPKGQFDRVLPYGISPEETTRQIADAMR